MSGFTLVSKRARGPWRGRPGGLRHSRLDPKLFKVEPAQAQAPRKKAAPPKPKITATQQPKRGRAKHKKQLAAQLRAKAARANPRDPHQPRA